MRYQGEQSRRRRERMAMPLPVQVEARESADHSWVEESKLIDVSPFGARFVISHPTEPGRLLHLTSPLPRPLRCFDFDVEQYKVWALVCHIKPLSLEPERMPRFEVGVAFTGQHAPQNFERDPAISYEITPAANQDSLWNLSEKQQPEATGSVARERRAEPRYEKADEVVIEVYDAEGNVFARETTRTENISRRGMCIITDLNITRGRYIRIRSPHHHIAVIGAVRRLRRDADGLKRLHLEFVDQQWPPL